MLIVLRRKVMNTLAISHEVYILIADFFIIWTITKLNRKTLHFSKHIYRDIVFIGLLLSILSLSSLQYLSELSFKNILSIALSILILSGGFVGYNLKKGPIDKCFAQNVISKITILMTISSIALGAITLCRKFLT